MPRIFARAARHAVRAPILLYRYTLSPYVGHVCRFHPTCSMYALEAIDTHGALRGLWLTARRLSRCHPIAWLGGRSGIDPVPAPRHEISAGDRLLPSPSPPAFAGVDTSPVNGGGNGV